MSSKSKRAAEPTVGARLKQKREELGLSLTQVEIATKIRGKYLTALEADNYTELPHDVYTRGFIQSYASYVGLNGKDLIESYVKEHKRSGVELRRRPARVKKVNRRLLTPGSITAGGVFVVLAAAAAYLVWEFTMLAAPPTLDVDYPAKDQVLYGAQIEVKGTVSPGADVFVNDSPILTDGSGKFTDQLALKEGLNPIKVTAKSQLGKQSTVTRNILAHVPPSSPDAGLPTAPFDGVAVNVTISGSATTVKAVVDGKEVFNGTMLPGSVQTFKGSGLISISTTNAKITSLSITNQTVAGKNLGPVGSQNEPKNDLEFAKDTQFP